MVRLRAPTPDELAVATRLCLRSKAFWGYDDRFMAACKTELTLTEDQLARDAIIVADSNGEITGIVQVAVDREGCFLEKLFVEPAWMGRGIGGSLFRWSVDAARERGADSLVIDSDPNAEAFYRAMGCRGTGFVQSASIPGRMLPRLVFATGQRHQS